MSSPTKGKKRIPDERLRIDDAYELDSVIEKLKDLKTTSGEAHALVKKILRAYYQRVWHKLAISEAGEDEMFDGGLRFTIEMDCTYEYSARCSAKHIPASEIEIEWSGCCKTHIVHDGVELGAPFDNVNASTDRVSIDSDCLDI
jgi:hypothetical protein